MRFDNPSLLEEVVWQMRLADLPRGENRAILNRLYNGDPPFDDDKAEENNIEINRNDLEGVNLLSQARRQWNTAFLTTENYFTVALDSGPTHKKGEWGRTITKHINRYLKDDRCQMEQARATGGNVLLHGPGLCNWSSRRAVVPTPLMVPSVLIPSETGIDFKNLSYIAFFREWTPAELFQMTHGPRVDPGWNMPLVKSQIAYVKDQVMKQPNATAYQYMPERIEELVKQDMGFWGSDAVPTIDVWDCYFREAEDGEGWYRRIILDWGVTEGGSDKRPSYGNKDAEGNFLYTSGSKKYADRLSEFFHCNFGDCSAVFPQKYHSVRSLGWMLWGVCDLQNRLHCKFNEAVFESLMWFFRVASDADLIRLKKANFLHMGVIPNGIEWVKGNERFSPDYNLIQMAFNRNRSIMDDSAAAFSQQFDRGGREKEMTATETMARVNQVNALVSGMLNLAYTYEEYKYREQCRRICIKIKPDPIAAKIRRACLRDGVPEQYFDSDRWIVRAERSMGSGNKTLAMAEVQFLQSIRANLGPQAQRMVDHQSIEVYTDDPAMAEQLAPVEGQKVISSSMHDAQLATERLMRGLPFVMRPDMVFEDYVIVWLADLEAMTGRTEQAGGMATADQILGWAAMLEEIGKYVAIVAQDPKAAPKVKEYEDRMARQENMIRAFGQRLQEQIEAQNEQPGQAGPDPQDIAKAQTMLMQAEVKAEAAKVSHASRTAQKQVSFELEQQRKDRESAAQIRRDNEKAAVALLTEELKAGAGEPEEVTAE